MVNPVLVILHTQELLLCPGHLVLSFLLKLPCVIIPNPKTQTNERKRGNIENM